MRKGEFTGVLTSNAPYLKTNFNNAFKITLFGMPGGAFFMCSLPLTLEPGYATGGTVSKALEKSKAAMSI